jgi:Fungal protein of unknown function (DUF2011)
VLGPDRSESFPGVAFDYEETHVPGRQCDEPLVVDQADGGETFEFRLFSTKTRLPIDGGEGPLKEQGLAKVNIRSPSPVSGHGDGGFVVPFRPQSYYFTPAGDEDGGGSERRKKEFADVAVDGEQILFRARSTTWVRQSPSAHKAN